MDWKCAGWSLARYIPVGDLHIRNMPKIQCGVNAYFITVESLFFLSLRRAREGRC